MQYCFYSAVKNITQVKNSVKIPTDYMDWELQQCLTALHRKNSVDLVLVCGTN